MLTVLRLGLTGLLQRTLRTPNIIENPAQRCGALHAEREAARCSPAW